jgi:cytochrome c-type biogenesis protein
VVYVVIGFTAGSVGTWLVHSRTQLEIVLGVVLILLGLAFAGLVPFLQRDVRVHTVPAVGLGAAPLLGFLFGLGWTPCVGPTLSAIVTLGVNEGTADRGALLAGVYCLGLGIPFVVAALAYRRALGAFRLIRRHQQWVTRIGGLMLVLVGLALVTGYWDQAVTWLQVHLVSSSTAAV